MWHLYQKILSQSKKYYHNQKNITIKKKYSRTGEGRKEGKERKGKERKGKERKGRKEGTKERRKCICANVCYAPACPNSPKIRFMVKYPSPGGWRGDTWYIISTRSIWYRRYRQSMGGILYPKFWNSILIIGTTYILYVARDGWGMRSTKGHSTRSQGACSAVYAHEGPHSNYSITCEN